MAEITLASGVSTWLDEASLTRFGRNEWPYYDGVLDRDPCRILPEDVQVTISMNSFVSTADRVREVHQGLVRNCESLLRDIPPDANLASFDPDLSTATALFDAACAARGVLLAVATKVLHRKRPGYIPMLDSVIIAAYCDALGRPALKVKAAEDKKAAGSVGRFVMNAFRSDVASATEQLEPLHLSLQSMGAPMTPVRLLEVAVWMANESNRYYRRGD